MKPKYQDNDYPDKLVAFLDILGFKKLVWQDKAEALTAINFIDERLDHILTALYRQHGKTFSTKLFSDCICLSCEFTSENLFYILYELGFIQLFFSFEGIFLKGALSKGNHFENDRMIFSRGLIKAYELEQSAIYPRIIIDPDLLDHIRKDKDIYYALFAGFKKEDFIIEAPDGHFILDYLHLIYEEGADQFEDLKRHKRAILKNVQQNNENIRILEKYRWVAEYHNYKFKEIYAPDDWEESYASEILVETSIDLDSVFPKFQKTSANNAIEAER